MTTRTFCVSGLTIGDKVCLTLASSTSSQAWNAPANGWGVMDGGGAVTIAVRRSVLQTAPEAVWFEASVADFDATGPAAGQVYDPRLHEIVYLWDFGDEGAVYSNPVNVLAEWKDANRGFGPRPAHVYAQPGTYAVSVLAVELASGKTATASTTVTVADPDAIFAGNTVTVGSTGTYATLDAALAARSGKTKTRIKLQRGQNHITPWQRLRASSGTGHIHIVADDGAGALPMVTPVPTFDRVTMTGLIWLADSMTGLEFTVAGVDFAGDWDPTTETVTTSGQTVPWTPFWIMSAPTDCLFTGCRFTGNSLAALVNVETAGVTSQAAAMTFHDNFISSWQNMGLLVDGNQIKKLGFMGNCAAQHVDANAGGVRNAAAKRNNHGCLRDNLKKACDRYYDGNDLFSNTGWTNNVSGHWMAQPCLRIFNTATEDGHFAYVCRNGIEGGFRQVDVTVHTLGQQPGHRHNTVIDGNYFTQGHMTYFSVYTHYGALTVRNNVFVRGDTPVLSSEYVMTAVIGLDDSAEMVWGSESNADEPVRIYSNTHVNRSTVAHYQTGSPLVLNRNGAFTDVLSQNNIVHQPNLPTPFTAYGPLDTTPLWAPRLKGYKDQEKTGGALWAQYGTPADTVWSAAPVNDPGGKGVAVEAIGMALSGMTAYDDMTGRQRPEPPSVGALETGT